MDLIYISDSKDPNDRDGRTYREINNSTTHTIPIGSLVELEDRVRLWVAYHSRDCNGTPLYYLSIDKDDTIKHRVNFINSSWDGGYSKDSLKVINNI